jgi:hypothetical protein
MGAIVNIFKAIFGGILGLFAKKEATSKSSAKRVTAKKEKGFYMAAPAVEASAAAPVAAVVTSPVEAQAAGDSKTKGKAPAAKAKKGEVKPVAAAAKKAEVFPEPIDLINAALAASKVATEEAQAAVGGFADKYMMPLPTPTRRPGANMAMYKSMAKDMKRF